ncbi:accessory Sec system glycosyltransferase Asp1 [Enterococcus lactis]|uniref:accessory Sec system glycosyltransferase Asp1 n=2 Tax=Enterococcus TaxID=1350 RepID=UPI0034E984A8
MIYFLTDWQSKLGNLETDVMFNVSKIFDVGKLETKTINMQLSPFLGYFVNPFEMYSNDRIIHLLDTVTERFASSYAPLTMNDLQLPINYEKTYTRTNVLLSKNGVIKGEVYFNQFGFVSQVHYHTKEGKEIQIYSDKGYILCKQLRDHSDNKLEEQLFDEGGQLIFTERENQLLIGSAYKKHFKHSTYGTFKEVCMELLNATLIDFNPVHDRLVIDGTSSWLMDIVEGFTYPETMMYVFSGDIKKCTAQIDKHINVIEKGKRIITDNALLCKWIEENNQYRAIKSKLDFMPLFPTYLLLGESNTYADQYVYWQMKRLDSQEKVTLLDFLYMKLSLRDLCLIIDSQCSEDAIEIQKILTTFIEQNFNVSVTSPEYELVKQYYEALENEEMTTSLRDLFIAAKQEKKRFNIVIEAYLFYRGVTFRENSSVQVLKEDFRKTRVFIDQRIEGEFFSHSLAVSAGIPIISKRSSPYLIENKNGVVFQKDGQLVKIIENYLKDTDKWNENLVESVDIIQNCSAYGLLSRWEEGLR